MSRRTDYYHDPEAPAPNSLVPGAAALVLDDQGRILMQRRADSGNWSLPGGVIELGETIGQAVVREVREETGLEIALTGLVGIYTDPAHVIAYDDGEVRQEFVVLFSARVVGGQLRGSDESTDVRFVEPSDVPAMQVHESVRLRIQHGLLRSSPYIG
jgi:8-oxo-dGTP pyrophosphatase MutT (NUDIX family)